MNSIIPISVVILTCNESERIKDCVLQAQLFSDNIVVVDSGSTDNTVEIARELGCMILEERWDGYGNNKNKGIEAARYDWILSLDADEITDSELVAALRQLGLSSPETVYKIPFKVFFSEKAIRFGSFGSEKHIRLFNRTVVKWAAVPVHETLLLPETVLIKKLPGNINHYAIKDITGYRQKMYRYATLSAQKFQMSGKRSTVIKRYVSPVFNFVKNYFFRLGFLDGKEGLLIAVTMTWYTWLKYHYLHQMEVQGNSDHTFQKRDRSITISG